MSKNRKSRRIILISGSVVLALAVCGWIYWKEILLFKDFEFSGDNPQGFSEYRQRETGIVFVLLPGGTFKMGTPETEVGRQDDEGPVHLISVNSFLMAKYELTQAQWNAVMGTHPSFFKGDNLPVERISWEDIQEFEAHTGLTLPSEAQWEYACRAGTHSAYSGGGNLAAMGWYRDNAKAMTHAVGEKAPNGFGLHDMHGNLWEWCEDVYDAEFYSRPEATVPDPLCSAGSTGRVSRGGCWGSDAGGCRSGTRIGILQS